MEACFELSIGNADKGLLPLEEIKRRVAQFTSLGLPLVVTQVGGWCVGVGGSGGLVVVWARSCGRPSLAWPGLARPNNTLPTAAC